ncbi:MAG: hypothetical protein K9K38_09515 [Rhodoferax sp.]|nr:hypothetical protein [Rhodoferax sp.]
MQIAFTPFASQSVHRFRPVQPVVAVAKAESAMPNVASTDDNTGNRVSIGNRANPAGEGLYNQRGTVVTRQQREESFDLTIQTAQGDTATISLTQSAVSSTSVRTMGSARQSRAEFSTSSTNLLDAKLRVQGELNAEETQAIEDLLLQVNGVAEDFFAGDMESANTASAALSFQGNTLSAFTLDLQSREMLRASAVYESVSKLSPEASTRIDSGLGAQAAAQPPLTTLSDTGSMALTDPNMLTRLKDLFSAFARATIGELQAPATRVNPEPAEPNGTAGLLASA